MQQKQRKYFLQSTDRVKGLLVKVVNDMVNECTFSAFNAMKFDNRKLAKDFVVENKLQGKYRPLFIDMPLVN